MPAKPTPKQQAPERLYPHLETFLENNGRDAASATFAETKKSLEQLATGVKGAAAKKALLALERTEALMGHLFDVKDKLAEQAKKGQKSRR